MHLLDWTTIIVAIVSALSCGGLTAFFTLHETRKGKKLDNKEKELDIEDRKKDEIISDWKELAEQRKQDLGDAQAQVKLLQARNDEKDIIISELRQKLDDVHSENVALNLTRCSKIQCENRIPPIGYKEIAVKGGRLIKSED